MFFSIRTFKTHFFEYKKQVHVYLDEFGLSVRKNYADYRKITEDDVQYLKENGFDYFMADYSGGFDEKPKNWKDFGAIEDEYGYVYMPFTDIDDAIRRKREYSKSQGYGSNDNLFFRIVFIKFISLSDIEAFYKISSYIQIDGQNFPFGKSMTLLSEDSFPTFKYYKDKFYIEESELEPSQIRFLEEKGFKLVDDVPESWYERQKLRVFALRFTDFDGFVIEKQNCDLNDFGKTDKPKLIGEKEVYYLDRRNPDPKVWEMLEKKYGLIEIYDF